MSDLFMFDAAYQPNLDAVKAHGVAVNCYISGDYVSTTTQPEHAHAAGLGVVLTYEEGRDELVHASRTKGRAVGRKILAALRAKGVPEGVGIAIYPSVDVGAPAGSCNYAWRGLRDVLDGKFSVRAYADGAIVDELARRHLVDGPCWLAAPSSWPGYRPDDPHVGIVQLVGSPVPGTDQNRITVDPRELGVWWPAGSEYEARGDDVSLSPADIQKIADEVQKGLATAIMRHPVDKQGHSFVEQVRQTHGDADRAAKHAQDAAQALNASGGVVARVAQIQAALDELGAAVKAIGDELAAVKAATGQTVPGGVDVKLDDATVEAVATAVEGKVRAVKWEAK